MAENELDAAILADSCYKKILQQIEDLKKLSPPTWEQRQEAWKRVELAYQEWSNLDQMATERKEEMSYLQARLANREKQLRATLGRALIFRLRRKMGARYVKLSQNELQEDHPILRRKSAVPTAPGP